MGILRVSICLVIVLCSTAIAAADPFVGVFVGEFNGEEYRLALRSSGNSQYEGTITIGSEPVPLVARRFGDQLRGQVGIGGDSFEFSAEVNGDYLVLTDDNGEVIHFTRE